LPGETSPIDTDQDWVVTTGGGYFFAPSIATLQMMAGTDEADSISDAAKPKRRPAKKAGKKK